MRTTIFFIAITFFAKAQVPTNGLVGGWPFSGNANDISINANHGTVSGANLTTDRCGNPNSAYHFNGTSDHITMLNAGPTGTVSRTFSFWARTTYTDLTTVIAYGDNVGGKAIAVQYNYNCLGVGLDVNNHALTRGNTCVNDGQWHHVVSVLNSTVGTQIGSINMYVDAQFLSSVSCVITGSTQTINTGSMFPIAIGRIHDDLSRFFSGDLDDFYVYDRALSLGEIQQLYTACSYPIFGNPTVCQPAPVIYSVAPIGNGAYSWNLPSGWTGSSTTNTISVSNITGSGVISVSIPGSCGASSSGSLAVTVNAVQVSSSSGNNNTICAGQSVSLTASGASTYTWMPGAQTGSILTATPTISTVYSVTAQTTLGCTSNSTVNVAVSKCTGITERSKSIASLVFPNPGNGDFKTNLKGSYLVQVMGIDGKIIYEKQYSNELIEINIANYANGVYFARFLSDAGIENLRLIKE